MVDYMQNKEVVALDLHFNTPIFFQPMGECIHFAICFGSSVFIIHAFITSISMLLHPNWMAFNMNEH